MRARQRRHIAVVDDFERHLPFVADAQEQILDLAEALLGDASEQRCNHRAIVNIDARRTAANRIHARHLAGRRLSEAVISR